MNPQTHVYFHVSYQFSFGYPHLVAKRFVIRSSAICFRVRFTAVYISVKLKTIDNCHQKRCRVRQGTSREVSAENNISWRCLCAVRSCIYCEVSAIFTHRSKEEDSGLKIQITGSTTFVKRRNMFSNAYESYSTDLAKHICFVQTLLKHPIITVIYISVQHENYPFVL